MVVLSNKLKHVDNCNTNTEKGADAMMLAMNNIKTLLAELREKDWNVTAFPFVFCGKEYVVVFEDLRVIDKGTKLYAVNLSFIDRADDKRMLQTYANAYKFMKDDKELIKFFGIESENRFGRSMIWQLYDALNNATPTKFSPIEDKHKKYIVQVIDKREGNEGCCCYKAAHNGKKANGEQKTRTVGNTTKTRLLRPELYELLGKDETISFYYRKENEVDDATIALTLYKSQTKKS